MSKQGQAVLPRRSQLARAKTDGPELAQSFSDWQGYLATILVLFILAFYIDVPLMSGGRMLVPSFAAFTLVPILFLAVRKEITSTDQLFMCKVIFVLLLSIVLSPGYKYLVQKGFSLAQFCVALAALVITVRLMKQLRPEVLERTLLIVWVSLIVGSVLEILGVLRGASDAFRVWAFSDAREVYASNLRDIGYVGWIRPKLFSTEPSYLAQIFIVTVNSWLLVRATAVKAVVAIVATGIMFVIMGSPTIVVSAVITMVIVVWNNRASVRARVVMLFASLLVGISFVAMYGGSAFSTMESRLGQIGNLGSSGQLEMRSENIRAVMPWITLARTWSRWPVFGVGFGGKDVAFDESGMSKARYSYRQSMGSNVAAEVGTCLGVIGSIWFVWLLVRQSIHTGTSRPGLLMVLIFLFSMLTGGLETIRYWGHIALFWGALAVADSSDT